MKLIFGTSSYLPFQPRIILGDIAIFDLPYVIYDLLIIVLAAIVWFLFFSIIRYTKIGKLLIAVIHDREIASSMGINVSKFLYILFSWMFFRLFRRSCFCTYDISSTWDRVEIIVLAFAVVVTGGLGSITGALLGALLIEAI